ncbi:peptidylprolyl isomerase [Aestuariirhabdus sp. LZHN29]|uniref:peptidylprolyl isomerase n=1 Tax=Aestuariirhabdus sp. LZHN29 TaxID=3417462 RepID=UPI003CE88731
MGMLRSLGRWVAAALALSAGSLHAQECVSVDADSVSPEVSSMAVVDGMRIGDTEFQASVQIMARERFYHFNMPEGEAAQFQREVIQTLIDARLLAKEAQRRGMAADLASVDAQLEQMDAANSENPSWAEQRDQVLAFHLCRAERQQLLEQLKADVEGSIELSRDQVENYYLSHPDKFTSPPQFKVQVIVIGVNPSMPSATWKEAEEQAQTLYIALSDGADFAELASEFSTDASASSGGEMGYIHQGMLGSEVEALLAELAVGEMAKPMRVLEGWMIIRLDDRLEAELNPLDKVFERASALASRDALEVAWEQLAETLRAGVKIEIEEQRMLPLPVEADIDASQG